MNNNPLDKALTLLEEAYRTILNNQREFDNRKYIPVRSIQQHIGGAISYLQGVKKNEETR